MYSSVSLSPLYLPTNTHFLYNRPNFPTFSSSHPLLINHLTNRNIRSSLSSSISERNAEPSWLSPDPNAADDYNGWAVVETPIHKKNKGSRTFLLVGVGTSIVALLAAYAYFSLSRRGLVFRFSSPLHALQGMLMPSGNNKGIESKTMVSDASLVDAMISKESSESVSDVFVEAVVLEINHSKRKEGKLGHIIIPVAMDSTQQEAVLILKKLKIIEDDVKADELCTRREYARWLVRANSLLQRKPRHRLVPSVALSGSIIAAFDDVDPKDPDFGSIQSLAEAGIILSKLSGKNFNSDLDHSESQEGVNFFPERYISRQDLINWKAKLEYVVMPGLNEEISRNKLGFLDTREISSDASVGLFTDMLAGDKSIVKKVFGQGKRFQPSKPSTKAQAAVSLTSGRMTGAIHSELSRLEAENSSRQTAMEEIRSELLERGDIQRFWDKKMEEEKSRGFEVERAYLAALYDLEQEKIVQENTIAVYLKQKAAMDCQKQLLSSLEKEVHEMLERLACERAKHMDEQSNVQSMLSDLQVKHEVMLYEKSILEAEVEAIRILRSWIEDEARKSQARAKVLEEVGRRWKWEEQS